MNRLPSRPGPSRPAPRWLLAAVAAWLAGAAACTRSPGLVAATGRVVFADGAPVNFGTIEFTPRSGGPTARAAIDPAGRFTLQTGGKPGAVPGDHDVVVRQLVVAEGVVAHEHDHTAAGPTAKRVNPRHARAGQSGLSARLDPQSVNDLVITVMPAPPR